MVKAQAGGKLIVLSDLHLWGPEDPLYRALLRFTETKLERGDKFFIVGDLFDLFVGGKSVFTERYHELVDQLKALGDRGVEVFYIEGNHDFNMEDVFAECPHVRMYADTVHFEWDGRKFHFAHGDRVNKNDYKYLFFHFLTRNLVSQLIISAAPGTLVDRVGRTMSRASRNYSADPPPDRVIQAFRNYACEQIAGGYDFVIMGHSHFLDDMRFRVDNHEGQYVNVGFPRKDRKYLELRPGDEFFQVKSWEEIVVPLRPVSSAQTNEA